MDNTTINPGSISAPGLLAGAVTVVPGTAGSVAGFITQPGSNFEGVGSLTLDAAPAVPVLPAWLVGADSEERAELEQLGVTESADAPSEADRDALASRLMRAVAEHEADAQRYDAAEKLEHDAITCRYDRLRAPAKGQLQRIGAYLLHLASTAIFASKAKSRSVGWGSYGRRQLQANVTVVDSAAMLDYLATHNPAMLKVDITMALDDVHNFLALATDLTDAFDNASAKPIVAALTAVCDAKDFGYSKTDLKAYVLGRAAYKKDGESIPGVDVIHATDNPWYKAEVLAGITNV